MPNPLHGKHVVVTRPRRQATSLCQALAGLGAVPVALPVIRLVPPPDSALLCAALKRLASYDWVVFTSANGLRFTDAARPALWPETPKVAVIGPATRKAATARNIPVHYMPGEYRAERIADGIVGQRVLLLRAHGARPALRLLLTARGIHVDEVAAYSAITQTPSPEAIARVKAGVDAITFTSGSTAQSYATLLGTDTGGALVACIGPVTAEAANVCGFTVDATAAEYTVPGLVQALQEAFGQQQCGLTQ